jgi:hypothetical protein
MITIALNLKILNNKLFFLSLIFTLNFNLQAQNLQYTFILKDSLKEINHVAKINGNIVNPIFIGGNYFVNIEIGDTLNLLFQEYKSENYIHKQINNFV